MCVCLVLRLCGWWCDDEAVTKRVSSFHDDDRSYHNCFFEHDDVSLSLSHTHITQDGFQISEKILSDDFETIE